MYSVETMPHRSMHAGTAIAVLFAVCVAVAIFALTSASGVSDALLASAGALLATVVVAVRVEREMIRPGGQSRFSLPSLPTAFGIGAWIFLVLGPVPSIADPSHLLFPDAARSYPEAYLFAGLSFAAYFAGAHLVSARTLLFDAQPIVSHALRRSSSAGALVLWAFVWAVRIYLASIGRLSAYSFEEGADLSGLPLYASYAMLSLRWLLIPSFEFLRCRTRGIGARFWGTLSILEVAVFVISSERQMMILAAAQLALARAYFCGWTRRRVAVLAVVASVVFFALVNPVIYIMRETIWQGAVRGEANQLSEYAPLFLESASNYFGGGGSRLVSESLERDTKYRVNSLYYLAAMIQSDRSGTCEIGWGEYTLRNAATVIPAFLWPDKHDWAIANAKLALPQRLGIPAVDYAQSLTAHAFSDFWWFGPLLLLFAGAFDQLVSNALGERKSWLTATLLYFALLPYSLAPVADFADHFLLRFRETGPFVGLIYVWERWHRSRASSRGD